MPTHSEPASSCGNDERVIQAQRNDCCSSNRGRAFDPGRVRAPREVVGPPLCARVEEGHYFSSDRINRVRSVRLVLVASRARETDVLEDRNATFRDWHDVIVGQSDAAVRLCR